MADELDDYLYPLDMTGEAASNLVGPENLTLMPADRAEEFNFVIPTATPFYRDTVILTHGPGQTPLIRGVHWQPGHRFLSANEELFNIKGGLYGSILLMDKNLAGYVTLQEYQTLGGPWTLSASKILELLNNRLTDPRIVTYEQVSGKPEVFPPQDHGHNASTDFTTFEELILAINDIPAAMREGIQEWLENPPILMSQFYTKTEFHSIVDPLEARIQVLETKVG